MTVTEKNTEMSSAELSLDDELALGEDILKVRGSIKS
jgi:hypothetical protein